MSTTNIYNFKFKLFIRNVTPEMDAGYVIRVE